ncbi:MAG: hypothetical protein ACI9AQ_001999, partial [Dinoroseobacter sp.]
SYTEDRTLSLPAMQTRCLPEMTSDAEADAFLDQDLTELDSTEFKPVDTLHIHGTPTNTDPSTPFTSAP